MKQIRWTLFLLAAAVAGAQTINLKSLDGLESKAKAKNFVDLDSSTLQMASKFLSGEGKGADPKVKNLMNGLKTIQVRNFEFDKPGAYSDRDLDAVRVQLKGPEWKRIVESKEEGEHSEVYLRMAGDKLAGLAVISAEPKEVSVVVIDGPINISDLTKLGGNMGIPNINMGHEKAPAAKDE